MTTATEYRQSLLGKRNLSPNYGLRPDGTQKGLGFFGELQVRGGGVTTEFSIGVQFDGIETQIPTLVPTLTQDNTKSR
ncbi:MAG: hypothetical protein ACYS8Z_27265 [Planctomycetota bacterium]|jgi:hypothetical protein